MLQNEQQNYHLTDEQKHIIKFMLHNGNTPESIVEKWDENYHHRKAPSIRTIYDIQRKLKNCDNVETPKKGPKKRSVLTTEKLEEIDKMIEENPSITNESLGKIVKIPESTTRQGKKILKIKKYKAGKIQKLTNSQKEKRVSFCTSFLRWNHQYQMRIWWSDESTFKVEELHKYQQSNYYAKENKHFQNEKFFRKKSVNVWAAIRGDGKLIYDIIEGNQDSENYIQLLYNKFGEMDFSNSFFMQDGAGFHTSDDAIEWINFLWKDRWIGLKSERLQFPPYSMDLTPMDFAFWSHVKYLVSQKNPSTTKELRSSIEEILNNFDKNSIIKMCNGVRERCSKCIERKGDRFEGY